MSKFIKRQNNLRKAQARFEKASKRSKQFQIQFERSQNSKGKFKTKANIVRGEKQFHGNNRGLLHKAVNARFRIKGDAPSATKFINSKQPSTFNGKAFKKSAQAVNFAVHDAVKTAADTALAAETVGIKSANTARREVVNKARQKYTREAVDDYHRGTFAQLRIGADAVKGTRQHFKLKKQYRLEKAKFKLKKAEYEVFKEDKFKPDLKKNKVDKKVAKFKFKKQKQAYKSGSRSHIQKAFKIRCTQHFKQKKHELKFEKKQLKTDKKFKVKELSNQRKIKKNSNTGFLVTKPLKYTEKRMKASAWQKAVNEDSDNDMMHVVDSVKRRIVEPAVQKVSKPERLQRNQKKRESLSDKRKKSNKKLKRQENRLKEKHSKPVKQRKKPKGKKSFSDKFKDLGKLLKQFIKNIYEKEVKKFFAAISVKIIIILLVFAFILMIFSSIMSGSGFILGTYTAQDYDLSEAEKYYTKLAYDLNEKVRKVGTEDWKKALKNLGIDTSSYEDEPDSIIWGRSEKLNYDAVYDFDCYKLWSFLCAYYYDFSAKNGDVKYWKFTDGTKNLLKEIFNAEYEFQHYYENNSHWEEYSVYGYDGKYHFTSGGGYNGHGYVIFKTIPNALKNFAAGNTVYFDIDNGEILNCNKGYCSTGFYFQDQRYIVQDPSGNVINPFYQYDETAFQTDYSGGYGKYYTINYTVGGTNPSSITIWIPRANYTAKLPDGRDLSDTFCVIAAPDNAAADRYYGISQTGFDYIFECLNADSTLDLIKGSWNRNKYCLLCAETGKDYDGYDGYGYCGFYQKYFWKKECKLYYNVKQKKTFDKVIEDKLKSMSHAAERVQYYNLLIGKDSGEMYGNHQTLRNLLSGDTIRNFSLKRQFGYEMTGWNNTSEGLYQGIKINYAYGSPLYAPFNCKITDVDVSAHKITLRKNDVQYWYDGSGGTNRDTEVYITNADLIGGLSKGDTLKEGAEFAKTTSGNVNIHIKIDTDGYGWDYVDPRLVLY